MDSDSDAESESAYFSMYSEVGSDAGTTGSDSGSNTGSITPRQSAPAVPQLGESWSAMFRMVDSQLLRIQSSLSRERAQQRQRVDVSTSLPSTSLPGPSNSHITTGPSSQHAPGSSDSTPDSTPLARETSDLPVLSPQQSLQLAEMLGLGGAVSIINPAGPSSTTEHDTSSGSTPTSAHALDWLASLGSPFYQPAPPANDVASSSAPVEMPLDSLMTDESGSEHELIPMDQDDGPSQHYSPPPEDAASESSDNGSDDISDQDRPATRREFAALSSVLGDMADAVHSSVQILESIRDSGLRPPGRASTTSRSIPRSTEENYDGDSEPDLEPRLTKLPKRRTQDQNELAAKVRLRARELMQRANHDSPFNLPSEQEVQAWTDGGQLTSASEHGFRPDLRSTPGTPWNRSHIKTFAQDFVFSYGEQYGSEKTIRQAFTAHLRSLKRTYQRKQMSQDAQAAIQEQDTRTQRKRNLYNRRLRICRAHAQLRRHERMIMRLGVDGMSSDESDHAQSLAQYRILIPRWRNPALAQWLRAMDWIYYSKRFSMRRRAGRGSRPRLRIITSQYSDSTYVPGLPKCAYNREWYDDLPEVLKEAVDAEDTPYDFSHDGHITLLAFQNTGAPDRRRTYN